MPKSVVRAESCIPGDGVKPESKARTTLVAEMQFESDSGTWTSPGPLHNLCLVFRILPPVFLILTPAILFAAAPHDLGW